MALTWPCSMARATEGPPLRNCTRPQLAWGCIFIPPGVGRPMLETLEGLGLTAYEAKALDHLVRHGDRTGPALSRETGIPFGRVYDTLNGLVERGLATSRPGRPRMFS